MLSNKPFFLEATYKWILASKCTPILVLDATNPHCKVPADYIEGGEIVFNISPVAIRDFQVNPDVLRFKASFSGVIHLIQAPVKAVLAIYAEENGEGLFFEAEDNLDENDKEYEDNFPPLKSLDDILSHEGLPHQLRVPIATTKSSKPVLKLVE